MNDIVKKGFMLGAYYDIEAFQNYISFLFLNMDTEQKYIDAYIEADINNNDIRKGEALANIDYRLFILHEDQYDAAEFYEFMLHIKLLIGFNSLRFDDLLIMKLFCIKDIALEKSTHWRAIDIIKQLADNIISNGDVHYKYVDEDLKKFTQWWQSIDLFAAIF
jgi:hypothetical protein